MTLVRAPLYQIHVSSTVYSVYSSMHQLISSVYYAVYTLMQLSQQLSSSVSSVAYSSIQ